ncbi:Hypothetical protein A7982_09658 [Minicystis rosea]|nr:Hypothetical protein A7982_09658 [Minicystis rosea]
MSRSPRTLAFLAALSLAACGGSPPAGDASTPGAVSAAPAAASALPSASAAPVATAAATKSGRPCGALECRLFDTPEEALAAVLEAKPLVLGIGEAHAQKGMEGVDSAAKRFTERFLPALRGSASDLVVELMLPPKGCKPAEQEVRTQQREVTKHQAESNQNEYVTMGDAARKLGVIPDALRPTCDDLERAAKAGDGAIAAMLETIARLAGGKAKDLVARNQKLGADKMVVLYGGALHNDAIPKPERASWSFGPELIKATGGRYVELDVFVPESIQDTDAWKAMAWYAHYDRAAHASATALFKTGPSSWALIFPKTAR